MTYNVMTAVSLKQILTWLYYIIILSTSKLACYLLSQHTPQP